MLTFVKRSVVVATLAAGLSAGFAAPAQAYGAGQFCSPSMGGAVADGANGRMACVDLGANGAYRWTYLLD